MLRGCFGAAYDSILSHYVDSSRLAADVDKEERRGKKGGKLREPHENVRVPQEPPFHSLMVENQKLSSQMQMHASRCWSTFCVIA